MFDLFIQYVTAIKADPNVTQMQLDILKKKM